MSDPTAVTTTPSNDGGNAGAENQAVDPTAASAKPAEPKEGDKPAEPQVPESYEFVMPEGVELDKAAADEFSAIAKELKLDQPTAQKVADVAAKMAQRQTEKHSQLVESWVESVKTDKDIGGDKLPENLAVAKKALDQFGTPELRDVLNATGFGNHPEVVRAFYKIGKAISQDTVVTGQPAAGPKDMAKTMFPTMN